MKKIFIALLIGITCSIVLVSDLYIGDAYAEDELSFITEYDLVYDISDNGETTVTQVITITNLRNDTIATKYSITINQKEIYDIEGFTKNKKITVSEETDPDRNSTTLTANFADYVIGEGRQNSVTIKYKSRDIATKFGEIWNINIPKTDMSSSTTRYNVNINLPKEFGPKIFVTPKPSRELENDDQYSYSFTKEDLEGKGVNASFGQHQLVNFNLKYQIENPYILSSDYEVAFPPEIRGVQQVKYEKIIPEPKSLTIDRDGNVIAKFRLKGKQKLDIQLIGKGRIMGRQINPNLGGNFKDIPKELYKEYTTEQEYWETDAASIKELSQNLYDPNKNVIQNAKNVYDYIVQNLEYDFDAVKSTTHERKGADKVLREYSKNTCMGFTDLFITTLRTLGIPAREINGYAFTNEEANKPISISFYSGGSLLHSWAEFYDPNYGWVQIDPTWGNTSGIDYFTKLDTNHFAFVVKGLSSEYPVPAGAYNVDSKEKLIDIEFSHEKDKNEFDYDLEIKRVFNWNIIKFLQGYKKFSIKNNGNTFVYEKSGSPILPGQEITKYVPKDQDFIEFEDFNYSSIYNEI